jgi:putative iron-dependent peroxidase
LEPQPVLGYTERILDFSTAVTGGLFFVPSASFLAGPPGGSLRIGGLKGAPSHG